MKRWALKRWWSRKRPDVTWPASSGMFLIMFIYSVVNHREPDVRGNVCLRRMKYILFIYLYFVVLCYFMRPQITASASSSSAPGTLVCVWWTWWWRCFSTETCFSFSEDLCVWFTWAGINKTTAFKQLIYTESMFVTGIFSIISNKAAWCKGWHNLGMSEVF